MLDCLFFSPYSIPAATLTAANLHYNAFMSQLHAFYTLPTRQRLEICRGDLTQETVDAIVNAANEDLQHGGGIAHAIVKKGGSVIQQESTAWVEKYGAITHDTTAYTNSGRLPCRYIIHAVGPRMGEGDEDRKLAAALTASLQRADNLGLYSIAIPAISTGIFGFPKQRAARIFFEAIPAYFSTNLTSTIQLVRVTLWEPESVSIFVQAARQALGDPQHSA